MAGFFILLAAITTGGPVTVKEYSTNKDIEDMKSMCYTRAIQCTDTSLTDNIERLYNLQKDLNQPTGVSKVPMMR